MKKHGISLSPDAQFDIKEAALWYQEQQAGLGFRFKEELRNTLRRIADRPLEFPSI